MNKNTNIIRIIDESILKYSAMPPHIPNIFLSVVDLYNRLGLFDMEIPLFFFVLSYYTYIMSSSVIHFIGP